MGFVELDFRGFADACDRYGKRCTIPVPREDDASLTIHVEDRAIGDEPKRPSISAETPDRFASSVQQNFGWSETNRISTKSIVMFRFRPKIETTSEMLDALLHIPEVLGVELTLDGWTVNYIIRQNWPNSLSNLKKSKPEYFNPKTRGARAGKSRFRKTR